MIRIRGLHHRFGDREVLRGIDLDVNRGEILAVMGASGGGKSTLLKIIGGLLEPTAGEVWIDDVNVVHDPDRGHDEVGLVFQSAALFDSLTVEENVLFGLVRKRKLTREERRATVERLLSLVALPGTERLMPSELSGGMRKRVGLARALATEPRVLLYDEPTSGLDPITAYAIDELIVRTRDRLGVTSVVVSHDVTSVLRVADRVAFLSEGRLTFTGTTAEFRSVNDTTIRELVDKARAESIALSSSPE